MQCYMTPGLLNHCLTLWRVFLRSDQLTLEQLIVFLLSNHLAADGRLSRRAPHMPPSTELLVLRLLVVHQKQEVDREIKTNY
jgi:hypothetical protein